jgi:hypothetical protein
MKTILSTLLLLSVLAGVAAPASALDAKSFFARRTVLSTDAQWGSRWCSPPRPGVLRPPTSLHMRAEGGHEGFG